MSLTDWRLRKLRENGIDQFYYFSLLENLASILRQGIWPKNIVMQWENRHGSFAEETVQEKRHNRTVDLSNGTSVTIHDLVPVYLTPRTPTLSVRRERQNEIFFLVIGSDILGDESIEFAFTDGNAASRDTQFFKSLYKLASLPWDVINSEYWTEFPDGRRRRNAEFLIYPYISPCYFKELVVSNRHAYDICSRQLTEIDLHLPLSIDQGFFFT